MGSRPTWGIGPPPEDAAWPRLMTRKHPRARGTFGIECVQWADGQRMHNKPSRGSRWWQRLALARALEHDAAGRLVWPVVIISGPRQTGKSWLERELCSWRIRQAGRFGGEEQAVLHVAHKLIAAQEVWRPAARWSAGLGDSVRWANGEQQIERPDGSRWLLQAANDGTGVAFSLSMALVDEGWRVARSVYEEAIEPTLAEAESPQTYLISTAGTAASDLMATYRTRAIGQLDDPRDVLLIEWSAPPEQDVDIDDPRVWRACQPHWDGRREAWITRKREQAGERAFRQQALNQWVPSLTPPVLAPGTYGAVATRSAPIGALALGAEITEDHSRGVIIAVGGGVAEVIEEADGAGWVTGRLAELAARHNAVAVGVDGSGPARGVAAELKAIEDVPLVTLGAGDMASASGQVLDALTGRPPRLLLRDHPAYEAAVDVARRRKVGGAWAWDRDPSALPLSATTAGWWALAHAPAPLEEPAVFA
jgi:hypothetical protein